MNALSQAAQLCGQCPSQCEAVCPALIGSGRSDLSPRGMILRAAADPAAAAPMHCIGCGACTISCDVNIDVAALLGSTRSVAAGNAGLLSDSTEISAIEQGWANHKGAVARTAVIARCHCGANGTDPDALEMALTQSAVRGAIVIRDVDCGRRLLDTGQIDAFESLSGPVADALAAVRFVVAPSSACVVALQRHIDNAGLLAIYADTLDGWLARFGVALPARTERWPPCRGPGRATANAAVASPTWPPAPTCCGAHGLLPEIAPAVANGAADAVIDRLEEAGIDVLHVEDAVCRAHLAASAARRGASVHIVDRASAWLASHADRR